MAARKAQAPLLTGLIERDLRDDAWAGSAVNDATADVGDPAPRRGPGRRARRGRRAAVGGHTRRGHRVAVPPLASSEDRCHREP
jgi:hypothetical protein